MAHIFEPKNYEDKWKEIARRANNILLLGKEDKTPIRKMNKPNNVFKLGSYKTKK